MWCPDIDDILVFHSKLVARTGGIDGIRSLPLIESALYRFHSSFGGEDVFHPLKKKLQRLPAGLSRIMVSSTETSESAQQSFCSFFGKMVYRCDTHSKNSLR